MQTKYRLDRYADLNDNSTKHDPKGRDAKNTVMPQSKLPDNKRMNSECSIWRVLVFSVNFAPGYPRRYVA